ncbi:MAG: hypothetical protein VX498_00665, partial [Myxococcota bacterium]|nr:hypothetical protein [Myxococcota bacterium]
MRPHRRFAPFLAFFLVVSGLASVAVGPAFALPSQVATSFDGGAGTPTALAVSRDGLLVAVSGSSGVAVWDLRARQEGAQLASVCTDSGAEDLVFVESGTMGDRFYVACSGGGLHYLTIDDSTIPVTLNESEKISLNLGSGNAVALVYAPGDDGVYAVIQDASLYSIDRIPLTTSSGDSELLNLALTGTAQAASVSSTGSPLVVTRSDGFVSNFERSGSSYSIPST